MTDVNKTASINNMKTQSVQTDPDAAKVEENFARAYSEEARKSIRQERQRLEDQKTLAQIAAMRAESNAKKWVWGKSRFVTYYFGIGPRNADGWQPHQIEVTVQE